MVRIPTRIAINQKTRRQPAFCASKPPTVGLIDGPRVGPTAKIVIARPRLSTGVRSAITPGPRVPAPQTQKACPSRKIMNMGTSELTAQATVNTRNKTVAAWMPGSLPYSSLSGAATSGPKM